MKKRLMNKQEMLDFIRSNNLNKKHKDVYLSGKVSEIRESLERNGYSTDKPSRKIALTKQKSVPTPKKQNTLSKQKSVPTPKKQNTLSKQKSVPVRSKPKSIGDAPKPKPPPKKQEPKSRKLIKIANIQKPKSGESQYILKIATIEKDGFDPIIMDQLKEDGWTGFKSTEKDWVRDGPIVVHLFKNTDDDEGDVRSEVKSAFAGMKPNQRKILIGKK